MAWLATKVKTVSIATGLYRPARWLVRTVRTRERRAFQGDIALYRSILPPAALCFDVGANIGEKSEALLESGARVIAFEPNPVVLPELRARCGARKDWTLVETALGSGPRIAILHARRSHGQSSLEKGWGVGEVIARFPVPVVTLDAAIECFGVPDYCKIDVEGWELEVLNGLTQRVNLISFEFHVGGNGPGRAMACLERLAQYGPSRLNITQGEGSTFLFEKWIPMEEFLHGFLDKLIKSLPKGSYGDIFVQQVPAAGD